MDHDLAKLGDSVITKTKNHHGVIERIDGTMIKIKWDIYNPSWTRIWNLELFETGETPVFILEEN